MPCRLILLPACKVEVCWSKTLLAFLVSLILAKPCRCSCRDIGRNSMWGFLSTRDLAFCRALWDIYMEFETLECVSQGERRRCRRSVSVPASVLASQWYISKAISCFSRPIRLSFCVAFFALLRISPCVARITPSQSWCPVELSLEVVSF